MLLLAQDLVEFSWRYQLLAVITLPPAGILGISALLALRRDRAELTPAATVDESAARPRSRQHRKARSAAAGEPAPQPEPRPGQDRLRAGT